MVVPMRSRAWPAWALLVAGCAAGALGARAESVESFVARHWRVPLAAQGPPPARFTPLEASLAPEACGTCHPAQLADWRTSTHAAAMGPGVAGQLAELLVREPAAALACQNCHAPLAEQAPLVPGALARNPAFDPALRARGIPCAACHVRGHERFGPPRRDGSLAAAAPRETLPHGGVTRTPAYLASEFCRGCHQFGPEGYALNGTLLENTYAEWKASRFAAAGVQCQDCHMPDRRHLWRGIHDADMVRGGLTITLVETPPHAAGTVAARLVVENSGVGHRFPTYVTPLVLLRAELVDAAGPDLAGQELVLEVQTPVLEHDDVGGQRRPVGSREPADAGGDRARQVPCHRLGHGVAQDDAPAGRQVLAGRAQRADARPAIGDVAVAVPGEDEDVVLLGDRCRLDPADVEIRLDPRRRAHGARESDRRRRRLETVRAISGAAQADQAATGAGADDEDVIVRLEESEVEVLLPGEESREDVGLVDPEVAPASRRRAPELLAREHARRRVGEDARRADQAPADVVRDPVDTPPPRGHSHQPFAAPSARGSEPARRPSVSSAMAWAWPMRSLHGSTTCTWWPRSRRRSATASSKRDSSRSAFVGSPHVRPNSHRGASTAACGPSPRSTSRATSAAWVCGWPSPPIVP